MKFVLTIIIIFSLVTAKSQAQMVSVLGKDKNGVTKSYSPTAMPITTTAATKFRNHSDSLRTAFQLINVLIKRNKILTDSLAITYKEAHTVDTIYWKAGNIRGKGTKSDPNEIIR